MTAQKMARIMVGDGKSPNKYFVTHSPFFMPKDSEMGRLEVIPGYEDFEEGSTVAFDDKEKALEYYRDVELKFANGIGHVMLEDRMVGVLCERFLNETVTYVEEEVSDMFVGL